MSLNQCMFIGNLGRDPETRTFQNGNKVCNLAIAVSEHWKDRNTGERREKTEWVNVAIFSEGIIRVAEQYLRKGSKVFIQGKMQTRKYQDKSGADRYSTEIVLQGYDAKLQMLDGRKEGGQSPEQTDTYNASGRPSNDLDDEIPFAAEWRA